MSVSPTTAREWLVKYISAVIDLPADAVPTDKPFAEIGIDSAELVIMTGVMEEEFSLQVPAQLPFEHPTVDGFIGALAEKGLLVP